MKLVVLSIFLSQRTIGTGRTVKVIIIYATKSFQIIEWWVSIPAMKILILFLSKKTGRVATHIGHSFLFSIQRTCIFCKHGLYFVKMFDTIR